jgi:hypothetical protein
MFTSQDPVVKQFLAGATVGPIGMSEEKDRPTDSFDSPDGASPDG